MSSPPTLVGLNSEEALARLARVGRNEVDRRKTRNALSIVSETVREPMVLLLAAAAGLYLIFGDLTEG